MCVFIRPPADNLPDLEIHENAAYQSTVKKKQPKNKKKTKIRYRPMNDADTVYENPVSSTRALSLSEKESVYENASYNLYDN